MNKIFILICLFSVLSTVLLPAQIQRKKTGSTSPQKTTAATELPASVANEPVIIAIEDGAVFIDRPEGNVFLGDVFEAYEVTKKFTHPVTGEEIDGNPDVLAQLSVTKIFGKYLECEASPKFAISSLKPGMKVRLLEIMPLKRTPTEETAQESTAQTMTADEKEFLSLLQTEIGNCPSKKIHGSFTESITQQGTTIYVNIVIENGKAFKLAKKKIEKYDKDYMKALASLKNLAFYNLGIKSGYTFILRSYNKKRTETLTVNLNEVIKEYGADSI
ncbi:MAG: hypothetical protein NC102_09805 [Clostridium sp.]|nr:hypothetical protein [Clostridium sp.]